MPLPPARLAPPSELLDLPRIAAEQDAGDHGAPGVDAAAPFDPCLDWVRWPLVLELAPPWPRPAPGAPCGPEASGRAGQRALGRAASPPPLDASVVELLEQAAAHAASHRSTSPTSPSPSWSPTARARSGGRRPRPGRTAPAPEESRAASGSAASLTAAPNLGVRGRNQESNRIAQRRYRERRARAARELQGRVEVAEARVQELELYVARLEASLGPRPPAAIDPPEDLHRLRSINAHLLAALNRTLAGPAPLPAASQPR